MDAATILAQTDKNQRSAADPEASAWVSASAGTGKTFVLISRLERLLLKGVPPRRILCLTYTNAAAAEMQNRLHGALKGWAAMADDELEKAIEKLTGQSPDNEILARARQLFTLTLEAEGGLKIYTIHGFCERLLHRFPLEAGIAPDFVVLDDAQASELQQLAADQVLSKAALDSASPLGQALADIVGRAAEKTFRDLLKEALRKPLGGAGGDEQASLDRLALCLGLSAKDSREKVADEMAGVLDDAALDRAVEILLQGKKTDCLKADALGAARRAAGKARRVAALREACLTQQNQPFSKMVTKALGDGHPGLQRELETARDRFFELWALDQAFGVLAANRALATLRRAIAETYSTEKEVRAALDYDDLIARTAELLNRAEAAQWVLYKLDGGIDHILVDEAQDTSPSQWAVINALAEEFFAGKGKAEGVRTVFAVGDEKQSIYGFQGADPARFAAAGQDFEKRVKGAKRSWQRVPLNLSFRSAPIVLEAVDAVFESPLAADGLTWRDEPVLHYANRENDHGLVEIWQPTVTEKREATLPFAPLSDDSTEPDAASRLAQRIASRIATWRDEKEMLPSRDRPIAPGDILILLRKRHPFALPMIRALKDYGIPVAGADRMRLAEQLAVMDLMAFGEVMLAPQDDLALACVLKSPLIGFNDGDLFTLAHGRKGSLWDALGTKAKEDQRFDAAAAMLRDWQGRADYLAPYEFFSGLLEDNYGAVRLALIARIGPDAGDAIDEFLNAALDYDGRNPPSLQGFLHWMSRAGVEIKRDLDQGRDEVRVMTVHGAKGLEADIVFLPDTCTTPQAGGAATLVNMGPDNVWVPPGGGGVPQVAAAKQALQTAEAREYHRLLYVAMTRARDRLYVCGFEGALGRRTGCWYDLIYDGLAGKLHKEGEGEAAVWRMESGKKDTPGIGQPQGVGASDRIKRPEWAKREVAITGGKVMSLTPSAVSRSLVGTGAHHFADQPPFSPGALADKSRFQRGKIIHKLLQYLPELEPERRAAAGRRFMELNGSGLDEAERVQCVDETLALLADGEFAELFGRESQAEVPIVARLGSAPDGTVIEISGQVDRLVVRDSEILIADYKTNRPPPQRAEDIAPAYIAQLAAYRSALTRAFPGRATRCAIVWTITPRLMVVPQDLLDAYETAITEGLATGLDASQHGT